MTLGPLESLVIALLALQFGYALRWRIPLFARLNLPAPVLGGLIAAGIIPILFGKIDFAFVLQEPLMIAFFTCIGFGASIRMVREGGRMVVLLLLLASALAVAQAVLGAGIALGFGLDPLLGALTGTATLSGGPATGLAFAPRFEAAGIDGASQIALANGMAGIVLAGLFASPISTFLIRRHRLEPQGEPAADPAEIAQPRSAPDAHGFLCALTAIGVAMWIGTGVSGWIEARGVTLPPYVGAMIIAAILRNLHDLRHSAPLDLEKIEGIGAVALSLFLTMAMLGLDFSLLAGLAGPLLVGLLAQLLFVIALSGLFWRLLGGDYDAAVGVGGVAGFMVGITANALAAMRSIEERFGPAPRALLTVPLVGAFLIDFVNALILTVALNL